jgi:hypothetical protein
MEDNLKKYKKWKTTSKNIKNGRQPKKNGRQPQKNGRRPQKIEMDDDPK